MAMPRFATGTVYPESAYVDPTTGSSYTNPYEAIKAGITDYGFLNQISAGPYVDWSSVPGFGGALSDGAQSDKGDPAYWTMRGLSDQSAWHGGGGETQSLYPNEPGYVPASAYLTGVHSAGLSDTQLAQLPYLVRGTNGDVGQSYSAAVPNYIRPAGTPIRPGIVADGKGGEVSVPATITATATGPATGLGVLPGGGTTTVDPTTGRAYRTDDNGVTWRFDANTQQWIQDALPPLPSPPAPPTPSPTASEGGLKDLSQYGPSNSGGYSTVLTGGPVVNVVGETVFETQPGDYKDASGNYFRYDTSQKQYMPIYMSNMGPRIIASAADFAALPQSIKNDILAGRETGYQLLNDGTDWLSSTFNPYQFTNPNANKLTQEQFLALPPESQRALLEGRGEEAGLAGVVAPRAGTVQPPSTYETFGSAGPWAGLLTNRVTTLPAQIDAPYLPMPYDYGSYLSDAQIAALYPPVAMPTYSTAIPYGNDQAGGQLPPVQGDDSQETLPPTVGTGSQGITPPPPAAPPPPPAAPPPPLSSAPPASTGTPPPTATTSSSTTGAGGFTTGNAQLDAILGPSGLDVLSYGGGAYQNLPGLNFLAGGVGAGDYATLTSNDVYVPALGVTLPAPARLNWTKLAFLQENSPDFYRSLVSLYKAGNINLDSVAEQVKQFAPRSSAYETSLVAT